MCKGLVNMVFVIQTKATDEHSISVGVIVAQQIIGDILSLRIAAKVS
jgi:hypothetical protein